MANSEQLEKIAISETSVIRCLEALDRLEDQTRIANVAMKATDERVRIVAVRRLTDPEKLADIAIADSSVDICLGALYQLNDQGQIRRVANEARDPMVKAAAANKHVDGRHPTFSFSQPLPPPPEPKKKPKGIDRDNGSDVPSRTSFTSSSSAMDRSQLDGSVGYGHFRRESGSFGSLPSYDDHSDESSP